MAESKGVQGQADSKMYIVKGLSYEDITGGLNLQFYCLYWLQ